MNTINLDANAGLSIEPNDLSYFINIETSVNNINGWSEEKVQFKNEYLLVKDKLLKTFVDENNEQRYSNLYYSFSVNEALRGIYSAILNRKEDMYVYPNQHPHITQMISSQQQQKHTLTKTNDQISQTNEYQTLQQKHQSAKTNACLINLLTSQTNEDQTSQLKDAEDKNYLYIIADATQALGRLKLKNMLHMIDCLIISPRKVGGMSNLCFVFVSKQFEDKYILPNVFLPETRFVSMVLSSARQVIDAFPAQRFNLEENKRQYQLLIQQLEQFDNYITVQQLDENTPQTYTSLIIELDKKLCPRLFQQELAKQGIQVGFETACQSDTSNKIRLSWRQVYENLDITQEIAKAIEACENDAQINLSGGYKLKVQQDKQFDPKQGAYNLSMYNRRLFYLRAHWVPLNTDDNKSIRYKIPPKYAVMFQNFVLQQHQDYYLYVPELKEEFKDWLQNKKEENYKLENPQYRNKESSQSESSQSESSTSEETPLEAFEYLYRVSKHIYLTPSPNKHQNNVLKLEDFEFDEKNGRYPNLPDDFVQLFQNTSSHEQNDVLYPMTYDKYKHCIKDEIDLNKEYFNNPSSEFVVKMKLPIQEHFINRSNSYIHTMNKRYVYANKTKTDNSSDETKNKSKTSNTRDDTNKDEQNKTIINPKYIQVIQPGKQYLNDSAIELSKKIIKENDKVKIVLIVHNPTVEQQEQIFKQGFEEVRQKILSYQNWYQQWYYDDNIYTYVRNLKY